MKTNIITIDADEIVVRTSEEHEFLLDSKEVARGYGVSRDTIEKHLLRHTGDLREMKHWIKSDKLSDLKKKAGKPETLWTKRGVIRLGFFIRSERAIRFRDAAEDLVLRDATPGTQPHLTSFLEKVVTSLGNLMETQKQIIVQQGELIKITVDHEHRLSDNAEGYRRLGLGLHTLQSRLDAIEAQPQRTARADAPTPKHQLFTLLDIDRALFTPESADWWVGTSTHLRSALAKTGLHLRQLGLRSLARQYPHRCVDLTSIARGKQRAYAIFRPGFTPDSLTMTLIRQELRNLIDT